MNNAIEAIASLTPSLLDNIKTFGRVYIKKRKLSTICRWCSIHHCHLPLVNLTHSMYSQLLTVLLQITNSSSLSFQTQSELKKTKIQPASVETSSIKHPFCLKTNEHTNKEHNKKQKHANKNINKHQQQQLIQFHE